MSNLYYSSALGMVLFTILVATDRIHARPALDYFVGNTIACCNRSISDDSILSNPFIDEIESDNITLGGGDLYGGPFSRRDYEHVLKMSWYFLDAQRSGYIPDDDSYQVSWRKSAHLDDVVTGGWYDAGDYLKLNFPLAYSAAMLSWGIQEFKSGYKSAGVYDSSKDSLKVAIKYLMDCHIKKGSYIGQIGHPDIDHDYWGRAHEQKGPRPYFMWTEGMNGADLMSKVSAALASASILYKDDDEKFSRDLLQHAKDLYEMAVNSPGLYSSHFKTATKIYKSSEWIDDMAWAAAWLFKATSNRSYLKDSVHYWTKRYWDVTAGWDNVGAPTAVLLYQLQHQGVDVPKFSSVKSYIEIRFLKAWIKSNGFEDIVKTPKGMSRPSWSAWGNLQFSTSSGFLALICAKYSPSSKLSGISRRWAQTQVDYAMGGSGTSYVVGFGRKFPRYPHHAGASCPPEPQSCGWSVFESSKPNGRILYGALVGGPAGPSDSSYNDSRDDYVTNEVAVDYNAAFCGALAGLIEYLDK